MSEIKVGMAVKSKRSGVILRVVGFEGKLIAVEGPDGNVTYFRRDGVDVLDLNSTLLELGFSHVRSGGEWGGWNQKEQE